MNRGIAAFATALSLIAIGCVITTKHQIDAHITLDIRHIQQQADNVLDYIEGKTDDLPVAPAAEAPAAQSRWYRLHDALAPVKVAYAAELKEATTPSVKGFADKMRERQPTIEALKQQKALGEDNRGYLAVRDSEALSDPAKKNEAQQLVAAENNDRKSLYREIAQQNADQGATLTTIERVFAQRRLERARSGEIFQLPPEGADFDKFKASSAGQKLGDACKPEAWVTIP
jgi:uncharacterized protein YdbL (DUF1318 family)